MSDASRPPEFIAWGELLWDLFPDSARLGGAAANAAYHAHCMGARALLVSRVGQDSLGARARDELERRGIDGRGIQVDQEAPTGTVRVEFHDGEPRYRIAEAVAWDRIEWRDEFTEWFSNAEVALFGTLAQRSALGFEVVARAFRHLPARARRLCDLNVREPYATREIVQQALALANVVKLNESELQLLERLFEQADGVSWLLRAWDIELVAVTRGARGAELISARERVAHPGFPLSASDGDSVGAGDAFSAALGLELSRGTPLAHCLAVCNRYAAHVASRAGGMPEPPVS